MSGVWKLGSQLVLLVLTLGYVGANPVSTSDETDKPKETKGPLRDLYGDPLPPGAVARIGTMRLRHPDWISCSCMSEDGRIAASASGEENLIYLWDTATGIELRRIKAHRGPISSLALSPDGKTLASGSSKDGTLRLWEAGTGEEVRRLPFKSGNITFSPDGEILATGGETVILWQVASGKILREFEMGGRVAFSSDGRTLAVGTTLLVGRGRIVIRLLDVRTGKQISEVMVQSDTPGGERLSSMVISPDGRTLAAGITDGSIRLLETATGNELRVISWPELKQPNEQHLYSPGPIMAFSADGKALVTGGNDCRFTRWDLKTGKELPPLENQPKHAGSLSFSRDGKCLAIHDGRSIHLWNPSTGKRLHRFQRHEGAIWAVSFSLNGRIIATTGDDHTIRIWNPLTGEELHRLVSHQSIVGPIAFLSHGQTLVSAGDDGTISYWDIASGEEVLRIDSEQRHATSVAVSPDGSLVATGGFENCIRLWDSLSGKLMRQLGHQWTEARDLSFSSDGKTLVSVNHDRFDDRLCTVRWWDVETGGERRRSPERPSVSGVSGHLPIAMSPDGKVLARGEGDTLIRVVGIGSGKDLALINIAQKANACPVFSPEGRILALAGSGDGTIHLWDALTWKEIGRFKGHQSEVNQLVFSPNTRSLASKSRDATILLWDIVSLGQGTEQLRRQELEQLWIDLAGEAPVAYRAMCSLVGAGQQSVAFLMQRLRPIVSPIDSKELARLIANLDDDQFAVREEAARGLEKLGRFAEPALKNVLTVDGSPNLRRLVEGLLAKLESAPLSSEQLRTRRGIQALEYIGTPEAIKVLDNLAKGAGEALETQDARWALDRLKRLNAD